MAVVADTPADAAPAYWGGTVDDQPAPDKASALSQPGQAAKAAAPAAAATPGYWDADVGEPERQPAPPPAPPAGPKPHEYAFLKGFVGQSNRMLSLLERAAGQSATGLAMAEDPAHVAEAQQAQDIWYKNVVEPTVQNQSQFELPPDAGFVDKAFHGLGATAGMIADAIATGGASGEAVTAGLAERGVPAFAARAAGGAVTMQAPAAANAIEVGNEVFKQTGDAHAAKTAGVTAYLVTAASGAVPMGAGGNIATRVATAAGAGVGLQEASRVAQNAALPENMRQPFSLEEDALAALTTAPFGLIPGHAGTGPRVREAPHNVMEEAQQTAAQEVAKAGGDALDQTVAATTVNAELGAHHDAAAVQAARDLRQQAAAEEAANEQALIDQGQREQAMNQAEAAKAPTAPPPETLFERREQEAAKQKERDFTAAKNQQGEQEVERGETLAAGAEKGGATEPKPTLAEALSPEQLAALQSLKERRAAAGVEPAPEPTVAERLEVQNPEDNFKKLPPEAPRKAVAPPEEEEAPEANPPPITAQTLAQRRQAAFDEALRAKIQGQTAAEVHPVEQGNLEALARKKGLADFEAEGAPSPEGTESKVLPADVPSGSRANRLAAIRAAAQKRPQRPLPEAAQSIIDELRAGRTKPEEEPRFAEATPEQVAGVQHTQEEHPDGSILHVYRSGDAGAGRSAGTLSVRELPGLGVRRAMNAQVLPGLRGRGHGSAMLERAVRDAHAAGQRFESDSQVSAMQQGSYENLRKKGFGVVQNPNADLVGNGELRAPGEPTLGESKGVYEVTPQREANTSRFASSPEANIAEDMRRAMAIRPEEAAEHLKPFSDAGHDFQIHDTPAEAAEKLPEGAMKRSLAEHPNAKGAFDPETNTVHIFAGAHDDPEDLRRTMVHELAHKGVRSFLGDDYHQTMDQLWRHGDAKIQKWMRDYLNARGLDTRDPRNQWTAADEYGAHLAETPDENPGAWRRIADSVRAGLRKLGLVREWNDNDVRHLLRASDNHLSSEAAIAGRDYKGVRFSEPDDLQDYERYAPDNPLAVAAKWGKTMEEQAKYNPGYARGTKDWMKQKWDDTLGPRLAFIGLRNLPDFLNERTRPVMSAVKQFVRVHDQMEGRRGRLSEQAGQLAMDWSKWATQNKRAAGNLGEIMHASTLGGVDPSRDFVERYTPEQKAADPAAAAHEAMRQNLHKRLQEYYKNGLDDKGREFYNKVRDWYQDRRADVLRGLEARINESGADGKTKKQLMAELRKRFESGRVEGPYFPLTRFGDRWARATDKDGNTVSFARFESAAEQKAWRQEAETRGFTTDGGKKMNEQSMMERIDPDFVKKVTSLAKDVDPKLADEIWQEYLRAMPEMSMRKQFIHRKGRLGFTMDALRGFAYNSFHSAHQIARLEYGNRLDTLADSMEQQARMAEQHPDLTDEDKNYAVELTKEMRRRLDWIKNPRAGSLASAMTKFGFGWYLGYAPATAFRISSQNMMLAQPMLAKYHGQLGATRELSRAVGQWIKARGSNGLIDSLRGDERQAMEEGKDQGIFSNTWTQTLASGGEGKPMTASNDMGGYLNAYNRAAAYLFNAMEHKNRMTTYLAAYRLGRKQGMDHETAQQHATDITWDSHFDYTNANRPRVLQNDWMKVAALFKQYSWGVTYRLAREFRNMTRMDAGVTPAERAQSTQAFAGLMARSAMFSGVTGLPLYWAASTALDYALGDKDHPVDSTAAMHKQLNDTLGQTAGDAIMTGPMGTLTGASLSTGASYNDLWYRPASEDLSAQDRVKDVMGQFMGAIPAIATNAAVGAHMMAQGNIERGIEHFLPPEAAALTKAIRYSQQGVTNLRGEPIVNKDELDNRDLFLQSMGFTPQKVADAYARNTAIQNADKEITDRRRNLMGALATAVANGNDDDYAEAIKDIDAFNAKNPEYGIGRDVVGYIRGQARKAATAINGINLPKGLSSLEQEY